MTELNETFNAADVPEDDRNFDPIPIGDYKMQIIESKIEDTKSGTGQMLVLTLEIIDGPMANRRIWDRLNIQNANPTAQQIAQRALADLCLAIGVPQLRNTDDLHFKPFTGKIGIRTDKTGQYGPQNTVRYKTKAGTVPAGKAEATPARAAAKPAAKAGAKPWANGPKKQEVDDEIPF